MENNEIMEVNGTDVEVVENGKQGMSTGKAMLLGLGLTAATVAVVKLCKKALKRRKADQAEAQDEFEEVASDDE